MLLKQLTEGQKFMFEDRQTPLAYADKRGSYPSAGTFTYNGVEHGTRAVLTHMETGTKIRAVFNTYYRTVLLIN